MPKALFAFGVVCGSKEVLAQHLKFLNGRGLIYLTQNFLIPEQKTKSRTAGIFTLIAKQITLNIITRSIEFRYKKLIELIEALLFQKWSLLNFFSFPKINKRHEKMNRSHYYKLVCFLIKSFVNDGNKFFTFKLVKNEKY